MSETSTTRYHSARGGSAIGDRLVTPAAHSKNEIDPNRSRAAVTARSTSSSTVTSPMIDTSAAGAGTMSRATVQTLSAANAATKAAPIPPHAPVTNAAPLPASLTTPPADGYSVRKLCGGAGPHTFTDWKRGTSRRIGSYTSSSSMPARHVRKQLEAQARRWITHVHEQLVPGRMASWAVLDRVPMRGQVVTHDAHRAPLRQLERDVVHTRSVSRAAT